MKWLADLFTDPGSRRGDEMAALAILGVLTFLGLAIYAAYKGQPFDPQAFGTGLGLAIGAAAAGMGLKSKLEKPDGVQPHPAQRPMQAQPYTQRASARWARMA